MVTWACRLLDVRPGEGRHLAVAFSTLLVLITGYAALETARDALLLTRLPPRALAVVYVATAILVLPLASLAGRAAARWSAGSLLACGLVLAAAALLVLYAMPVYRVTSLAIYVTSGLIAAVLVPLFWNMVASLFNAAQGRRLLGLVGAGGILGGVLGSGASALLIGLVAARELLLVPVAAFLIAAVLVMSMRHAQGASKGRSERALPTGHTKASLSRQEPATRWVALLVASGALATLVVDYQFKWTVARAVPHESIAPFVARTYALLNILSLFTQLLITGWLVRRAGITTTMITSPLLLVTGGLATFVAAGFLAASVATKFIEGTLHNSLNRVTVELLYLPVPDATRSRVKPFIDGAVVRLTQAVAGSFLLVLGAADALSSPLLGILALFAGCAWLLTAVMMRRPYLAMLRRAVGENEAPELHDGPLDAGSAQSLVELLAHSDPIVVVGIMGLLVRRRLERLIPPPILLHRDGRVLVRALAVFGASRREDWIEEARRLLCDDRESVRTAAARALATQGRLDVHDLPREAGPRLKAYAELRRAMASPGSDPHELLEGAVESVCLGLLDAMIDAQPDARLARLLRELEPMVEGTREATEMLAKAAAAQQVVPLVPALVTRLARRESREVVRASLVSLGEPALAELSRRLVDRSQDRHLRAQWTWAIAKFGTCAAAETLLQCIESDPDGLVRYSAIRGLGRIVGTANVSMDRRRVERLALANILEHFRLLGLRTPIIAQSSVSANRPPTIELLLVSLLDDKLRQSLDRVFRLLQVAHPRQDIRRVRIAALSGDRRARANACEFLDALLRRADERPLRQLLLLAIDDLPMAARVERGLAQRDGTSHLSREDALGALARDSDTALSDLASLHLANLGARHV
jgi:HEAT repeat protein